MPRFVLRVLLGFAVVLVVHSVVQAQAPSRGERLLPKTTKGALLVGDVEYLDKQWSETELGKLMDDPVMQPFVQDLRRQLQQRLSRLRQRLGLELDDLRGVPSGELNVAVVQPAKDQAAVVLLMEVKGHLPQARELLAKVSANMAKQGATKTSHTFEGAELLLFDVPATHDFPAGQVAYVLWENESLLGAADNLEVLKDILRRKAGQGAKGESLADVPAFRHVMAQCQKHAGPAQSQVRWFVEPMGYAKCMRTLTPEDKRRKGTTLLDIFQKQGFYAIQGVGGTVDFKVGEFEILHRTAFHAPRPWPAAPEPYKDVVPMDMLTLPNSRDHALPPFISNEVAMCSMVHWDILKAFDNFGPTFDQLFGENETGIWQDVLDSLEQDEDGPRINLRNELIQYLDNRVTVVSDYALPITTTSERLLVAIRIKPGDAEKVAAGLKKWFGEGDPTIRRREFKRLDIWETIEQEQMDIPKAPVINLPHYTPEKKTARRERVFRRGEEEGEEEPLLPHRALTVANGYLLIASHYDFLEDVLGRAQTPDPLADSLDFKLVGSHLTRLGAGDDCLRTFSRTDEEFRPTYELIRMGKMPEAETMFARMVNTIFGPREKGVVRKQQIDGSQMPDYDVVRRALGPAGTFGRTEEDGWFVTGFMLKKSEE